MIQKHMEVGLQADGAPHATYEPRLGADFHPVDVVIPALRKMSYAREDILHPDLSAKKPRDEVSFRDHIELKVRECCGNTMCNASVHLSVSDMIGQPTLRIVNGATINCPAFNCPLIEPPESGDREPLIPAPQPPALESEIELPL